MDTAALYNFSLLMHDYRGRDIEGQFGEYLDSDWELAREIIGTNELDCLNVILDVLTSPPELILQSNNDPPREWVVTTAAFMIGIIINRVPDVAIGKLQRYFDDSNARLGIIRGIHESWRPETVMWLRPLAERTSQLTDDEAIAIVDAIGDQISQESIDLLRKMKRDISDEKIKVHKEIDLYLSGSCAVRYL